MVPLINRLRTAAIECSKWDLGMNPPLNDWSDLLDEAADALQEVEDDAPFNDDYPMGGWSQE